MNCFGQHCPRTGKKESHELAGGDHQIGSQRRENRYAAAALTCRSHPDLRLAGARLVDQHHRDLIADRISKQTSFATNFIIDHLDG